MPDNRRAREVGVAGVCRILGRLLPFYSTSVDPLLFHPRPRRATHSPPLPIQFWYGAAHPIPPRLPIATRSTSPKSCYPFLRTVPYLISPTLRTVRGQIPRDRSLVCLSRSLPPVFYNPFVSGAPLRSVRGLLCSHHPREGSRGASLGNEEKRKKKAAISIPIGARAFDPPSRSFFLSSFLGFLCIFTSEGPTIPRGNIL